MIRSKIKKAVILAGGQETALTLLTKFYPVWMLPVLNKPLIQYTIDFLSRNGIEDIVLTLSNSNKEEIPENLLKNTGCNIFYNVEDKPQGSAGALKSVEKFINNEPFLVISAKFFAGQIKLTEFTDSYFKKGAAAIVGVSRTNSRDINEDITVERDKSIKDFHRVYSVDDVRWQWKSSGIYLFNPSVLRFIDKNNYMDIKDQLIPLLLKEKQEVFVSELQGFHRSFNKINDYINIQRDILLEDSYADYITDVEEITEGVWAGRNVVVSPQAYLLGPVIIGNDCTIGDGAQIIGPTVIGNGNNISGGSLIRESILWDRVLLSRGVRIEFSIIGGSTNVPSDYNIKNMLVLAGVNAEDVNLRPSDFCIRATADLSGMMSKAVIMQSIYKLIKRTADIVLSVIGLVGVMPLFLLIAIAVKLDSEGPVFYSQRRCGLRGRLFGMIKFRTMVADAEKLHKELLKKNEADGPVFKIFNDPRVTRVGKFLRKTSLDEIPQLFNVLKGDMSLVGPRPLITDEMKFSVSWRDIRLKVKPGITGLWQVEGRSEAHFHDWIKYDVFYVKNQSLWLDLKILLKTVRVVLKKVGAY